MGLELKKVQFSQENKQLSFWKKKQTCLIYSQSEKSSSVFEGKLLESFFFPRVAKYNCNMKHTLASIWHGNMSYVLTHNLLIKARKFPQASSF